MNGYTFYAPTKVLFGMGALDRLQDQTLPRKKALLVISNGKSALERGSHGHGAKRPNGHGDAVCF